MIRNFIRPTQDGREACALDAVKFWRSRMVRGGVVPAPPELVDLEQLAREVRRAG